MLVQLNPSRRGAGTGKAVCRDRSILPFGAGGLRRSFWAGCDTSARLSH